jgi:hypothetical protein
LTKALETALGHNIRNFNFFLPPSSKAEQSNNVKPAEPTIVLTTKKEKGLKCLYWQMLMHNLFETSPLNIIAHKLN